MPNYKGHLAGAVLFYASAMISSALLNLDAPDIIQSLFFTCLGALFPDIDTKSKGQKIFYLVFAAMAIVCVVKEWYGLLLGLGCIGILPLISSHRGLFHNLWFLAFLTTGAILFLTTFFPGSRSIIISNGLFFFLGIISHLILDFGFVRTFRS